MQITAIVQTAVDEALRAVEGNHFVFYLTNLDLMFCLMLGQIISSVNAMVVSELT